MTTSCRTRALPRAPARAHACADAEARDRCDPLCVLRVDEDLTVRVVAQHVVPPGAPISIDYEQLEEDMVCQGVDFECACGTALCRGRIVGARRRAEEVQAQAAAVRTQKKEVACDKI